MFDITGGGTSQHGSEQLAELTYALLKAKDGLGTLNDASAVNSEINIAPGTAFTSELNTFTTYLISCNCIYYFILII